MSMAEKAFFSFLATIVIFQVQTKMCQKKEQYKSHESVARPSDDEQTYTCEYSRSGTAGGAERAITCKYHKSGHLKPKQDHDCPATLAQ